MQQALNTLKYVLENGVMRDDRTKVGRHGVFSPPDEIYNLKDGFPLATIREIKTRAVIDELLWFISGSTVTADMKYKFFWDKWTAKPADAIKYANEVLGIVCDTEEEYLKAVPAEVLSRVGTIGNLYGVSWRNAPAPIGDRLPVRNPRDLPKALIMSVIPVGPDDESVFTYESLLDFLETTPTAPMLIELQTKLRQDIHNAYWANYDQLNELVHKLKNTPNSSRMRVTAYLTDYIAFEEYSPQENVMDGRAALTACHTFFQCYVNPGVDGGKPTLDLKLTLTSSDVPVGRVYNVAQYAMLTHMLAHVCGMEAGRLIISTGDAHIYSDQFEAVDTILKRTPLPLPKLWLNPEVTSLFDFTSNDILIEGYTHHPHVHIPVAV